MAKDISDRARTPEEKRAVIERLYAAWLMVPRLRLGQLVTNAIDESDVFSIEDKALASDVESFANKHGVK